MAMGQVNYGPPMSDSDDSDNYDGFYFNDMCTKKSSRSFGNFQRQQQQQQQYYEELLDALMKDDAEKLTQQVLFLNLPINDPIKQGLTPLLTACREGQLACVRCLLEEHHANANKQVDSLTPLLLACDCASKPPHIIDQIVQLLLKHDAIINVSDKYGTTPFMLACKHGHTAVVRRLLKDVSFDAVDNQGCTPIFHAIENNRAEVVKLLVEAGVNATIANKKGYTPVQVAQFHGFYDLLELLPKPKDSYVVPAQFLGYNTLTDHIPRIFLKTECPEYFQEIYSILLSLNMEKLLEFFAKERVSLLQFLSMNDKQLEEIGIEYPICRMKILKGLLEFHLYHWSKKSIARVSRSSKENFYEILMIAANHLKHLVIIISTLRYIKGNLSDERLGRLGHQQLDALLRNLTAYRMTIKDLRKTTKYLASFSPTINPLYIDYDEYVAERKRLKMTCYFKYTTIVIGISVFLCFKMRKIFFCS